MREFDYTTQFKKDYRKVKQYPSFKEDLFEKLISDIANGLSLDRKYNDHDMAKHNSTVYKGTRNFHVAPDIAVIYRLTDTSMILIRIGKHNTLKLTT